MAGDFKVDTKALDAFSKDLKAAPIELRRELYKGLNSVTKPIRREIAASALVSLPEEGGLAKRVATSSITARIRVQSSFGVKIQVKERKGKPVDPDALDRGRNYHLTFGRGPARVQSIAPGWFARPWTEFGHDARRAMVDVVDKVARKLERGR